MRRERAVPEDAKAFVIQEVVRNAEMIWRRIDERHIDKDLYARSTDCQDQLTMPMLRICELVSEYRSVFEEADPTYPWADVAKMRSKIAHPYVGFDFGFVWNAIEVDLPKPVRVCRRAVEQLGAGASDVSHNCDGAIVERFGCCNELEGLA